MHGIWYLHIHGDKSINCIIISLYLYDWILPIMYKKLHLTLGVLI